MASKRKQRPEPMPVQTPVPPPEPREIAPPSPVPAARSIFAAAHIEVVEGAVPEEPWRIVGKFLYWPLTGYWRSEDFVYRGGSAFELRSLIRRQAASPEAVDAVARALDPVSVPETINA